MPNTTRQSIREEIHDLLYAGTRTFRRLRNGPDSSTLTEFTATTTITDTALKEIAAYPNDFDGAWIRLMYYDNSVTPALIEQVSRIHQFDPASGTITFSPTIGTVNVTAGTVDGHYEIWPDIHPDEADNAVNRILKAFPNVAYLPVTALTDGDMEDSDTSAWTGTTMATFEKATSGHPFGRQALHSIANATADLFLHTNRAYFDDAETVYMYLPLYVTTASSVLTVAMLQGSDRAAGTLTDARNQAVMVRLEATADGSLVGLTPQVTVDTGATSDFYTGFVAMYGSNRHQYVLDSASVEFAEDVQKVFRLREGISHSAIAATTGSVRGWLWDDTKWEEVQGWNTTEAKRATEPRRIHFDTPITDLHMMEVRQRHASLSADTSATFADKNTVLHGALHYIEEARGNPKNAAKHLRTYHKLLDLQGFGPQIADESSRQSIRFR